MSTLYSVPGKFEFCFPEPGSVIKSVGADKFVDTFGVALRATLKRDPSTWTCDVRMHRDQALQHLALQWTDTAGATFTYTFLATGSSAEYTYNYRDKLQIASGDTMNVADITEALTFAAIIQASVLGSDAKQTQRPGLTIRQFNSITAAADLRPDLSKPFQVKTCPHCNAQPSFVHTQHNYVLSCENHPDYLTRWPSGDLSLEQFEFLLAEWNDDHTFLVMGASPEVLAQRRFLDLRINVR